MHTPSSCCQNKHPAKTTSSLPDMGNGYFCPMCPEVFSASPGSCPQCGMPLETTDPTDALQAEGSVLIGLRELLSGIMLSAPILILAMAPMLGLSVEAWIDPHKPVTATHTHESCHRDMWSFDFFPWYSQPRHRQSQHVYADYCRRQRCLWI